VVEDQDDRSTQRMRGMHRNACTAHVARGSLHPLHARKIAPIARIEYAERIRRDVQ